MTNSEDLKAFIQSKKKPRILVVGDIMADRYVWGKATRISPEAPVPVVMVKNETIMLGGAGNVAHNLCKLNAQVSLCGILGKDDTGADIHQQLKKENIDTACIVEDANRPTTLKTRIMADSHQLLRVDRETTSDITKDIEKYLLKKLSNQVKNADIVMLSDYNKGLFSYNFTRQLIQLCNQSDKKVIVDPKGLNYEKYTGAWLIKPNRRELADASHYEELPSKQDVIDAAKKILTKTKSQYIAVTMSEEGLVLISKKSSKNFLTKTREVFDVTGAGDTVFASFGYFLSLALPIEEACELANYAAAVAVSKVGSVAVTIDEVLSIIESHE